MTPRLGPAHHRVVRKALLDAGFEVIRQKGSHVFFRHPDGRTTIVADHAAEIPPGTLRKILRDTGLDPNLFR